MKLVSENGLIMLNYNAKQVNIVASNKALHNKMTGQTRPVIEKLRLNGIDI